MYNSIRTGFLVRWLPLALCAGVLAGCASGGRAPVTSATGDGYSSSSASRTPSQSIRTTTMAREHTVRAGEGLYAISRQYGVSVQDLRTWNAGQNLDTLRVGQRLYVSPPGGTLVGGSTSGGTLIGGASAPSSSGATVGGAVAEARPIEMQPMLPLDASQTAQGAAPAPAPTESTITGAQFATSGTSPAQAAVAPAGNNWMWPTNGEVIKGFGNGSKGLDIAGKVGDPVQAAAGGTVAYAGSGLRGLGKLIVIRHENDYLTAYAHNSKLLVKEGDKVQAGQKIAEVGDSDASRPMLHFELRKGGTPVDPANHLPKR